MGGEGKGRECGSCMCINSAPAAQQQQQQQTDTAAQEGKRERKAEGES